MNAFYEAMAATAKSLISQYGGPISLIRTDSAGVTTTLTVTGIITSPITNYIHPTQIEPVDKRGVFTADIEIRVNDRLVKDGDWIVTRVEDVKPADTVLVYRVELRRG